MFEQINEAAAYLREQGLAHIRTGVILGTGLGRLIDHVTVIKSIPYKAIPHFPVSTVESHKGCLLYARAGDQELLIMQGRFHYYEGYTMQQVVFPVRVMKLLGVETLIVSNASGGLNESFRKGDLVVIEDHINLQTSNPLTGRNIDELGPRFPDMSRPYSARLMTLLREAADRRNTVLKKGVYAAVNGPNLETRAEYRFLRMIGADMVGMSTVPEVIAACHMKMECVAVSVITDECNPDNLSPVDISEIIAVAERADGILSPLLCDLIKMLNPVSAPTGPGESAAI
jgi:purine-nucleoside phosphorylase